jgi:hypothetical protein
VPPPETRPAASLREITALLALESPPARRYSKPALAVSCPSYPPPAICPYSCSVCATKGGLWMWPTICGVLLLDPAPYSPLELGKSIGGIPGFRDGIKLCDPRGIRVVNPRFPAIAAHSSQRQPSPRTTVQRRSHIAQTQKAANPGIQVVL